MGLTTRGSGAALQSQVTEQEGTQGQQALCWPWNLLGEGLGLGLRCRGHCVEAGAGMTQPLHLPLSFQLKVTAVPGLLLSLSLGSFSKEYPAGPSPRPMAKPRALSMGEGGP